MPKEHAQARAAARQTAPVGSTVRLHANAMECIGSPKYCAQIEGIVLGPYDDNDEPWCDYVRQTNMVGDTEGFKWFVWRGHYDLIDRKPGTDPNGYA